MGCKCRSPSPSRSAPAAPVWRSADRGKPRWRRPGQRRLRPQPPALQAELHRRQAEPLGKARLDPLAPCPTQANGRCSRGSSDDPVPNLPAHSKSPWPRRGDTRRPSSPPSSSRSRERLSPRFTVWRGTPTPCAAWPWLTPCCAIRKRARRRSSSCADRPMLRKSPASLSRWHRTRLAACQVYPGEIIPLSL